MKPMGLDRGKIDLPYIKKWRHKTLKEPSYGRLNLVEFSKFRKNSKFSTLTSYIFPKSMRLGFIIGIKILQPFFYQVTKTGVATTFPLEDTGILVNLLKAQKVPTVQKL